MKQGENVSKILNFSDGSGNTYRTKCQFTLHDGRVFSVYDCPAVKQLKYCNVSYGIGNEVFIQPRFLDDGSEPDKNPYKKENIIGICATCTMKQNCGR